MRWMLVFFAVGACGDPQAQPDAMADVSPVYDDIVLDADPNMPATLADTGLCVDAACTQIASGVHPYKPRYELWSDTATKRRWLYLPPGTKIDTSDMDHWSFPVGAKLWKEFTRDGVRVETRLIMRVGAGDTLADWFYAAYVWNQAQDATTWAEFGQADANGTQHDVPGKVLCRECHENNKPSRVLGFSALQLDFDGAAGDIDLADAIANDWLTAPPAPGTGSYFGPLPGTVYEPPALGYLHANCGHCHNPSSGVYSTNTQMVLRLTVGSIGALATTPTYLTAVGVTTPNTVDGHDKIVDPTSPDTSVMIDRFEGTGGIRMPAAGSEFMDPAGQTILRDWITNIPP